MSDERLSETLGLTYTFGVNLGERLCKRLGVRLC